MRPRPAVIPAVPADEARIDRFGAAAVTTVAVGAALVIGGMATGRGLPCPLLALTGAPCPACGTTTLATMVLRGELTDAVTADPAGVVVLLLVGLVAAVHRAGRRWHLFERVRALVPTLVAVGLAGVVVHWITTIVAGGALAS